MSNRPIAIRPLFLCLAVAAALYGMEAFAISATTTTSTTTNAASSSEIIFDRSMLPDAGDAVIDLSRFERGNVVLPGIYSSDIYLNGMMMTRSNVRFAAPSPNASAVPCVDRKLLDTLDLHPDKLTPEVLAQLSDPNACVSLDSLIPGAALSFDAGALRLDASVPQAALHQMPRGYVSPEYWDAGVPAALLNYNFNGYRTSSFGQRQTSYYLGLNAGFNIGAWHFRNDSAITWMSANAGMGAQRHFQNIDTYVKRDIPAWQSQLTLGDTFTDGRVFDNIGIRGVQLGTDDQMLPQSLQGYAPVIRGVAQTNAMVTVKQNGSLIYQATVAPGPFEIKDLYPTGYGGNLDVTVTEANGVVHTYSVPYASLVQLLRPGVTRFNVAAGVLRNPSLSSKPWMIQGTLQRGFTNLLTGYAGIQASQGYLAMLVGSAINTKLGAFALDITDARANIPGYSTQTGQSMRVSYSKIIPQTDTSLSVAAYRYSTSGFLSLADAEQARDYVHRGISPFEYIAPVILDPAINAVANSLLTPAQRQALYGITPTTVLQSMGIARQRSNFTLTLSQQLGQHAGSLYANTSIVNYWNRPGTSTQYQVGYSNSFRHISFNISATRTLEATGQHDNQYFFSVNVPLGDQPHSPLLSTSLIRNSSYGTSSTQEQATLTGSLGADSNFNYSLSTRHGGNGIGYAGDLNLGYRSPYATFNASYGDGSNYSQASVGMSGSIIAHPGGVTFGQPVGDTVAIVYAPGAAGARVENASGARVDRFGYAIVPYLTPYQLNNIALDPKGLPIDVQLNETGQQVAPHAGAIVMLKFKTESGRALIVHARMPTGEPLPFATEVVDQQGATVGIVGQGGQILVRGVHDTGTLTARWQDEQGASHACSFDYAMKPLDRKDKAKRAFDETQATCTPLASSHVETKGVSS